MQKSLEQGSGPQEKLKSPLLGDRRAGNTRRDGAEKQAEARRAAGR